MILHGMPTWHREAARGSPRGGLPPRDLGVCFHIVSLVWMSWASAGLVSGHQGDRQAIHVAPQ